MSKYRDADKTLDNVHLVAAMAVGECRSVDAFDRTLRRILHLVESGLVEPPEPAEDFDDEPTPVADDVADC